MVLIDNSRVVHDRRAGIDPHHPQRPELCEASVKYLIVIKYVFSTEWLRMSRTTREEHEREFREGTVAPFADHLTVRHFDAEAFAADHSDFLVVETEGLGVYYHFVEKLRDSDIIAHGWARITDISIGIEDGYKEYAREHA